MLTNSLCQDIVHSASVTEKAYNVIQVVSESAMVFVLLKPACE